MKSIKTKKSNPSTNDVLLLLIQRQDDRDKKQEEVSKQQTNLLAQIGRAMETIVANQKEHSTKLDNHGKRLELLETTIDTISNTSSTTQSNPKNTKRLPLTKPQTADTNNPVLLLPQITDPTDTNSIKESINHAKTIAESLDNKFKSKLITADEIVPIFAAHSYQKFNPKEFKKLKSNEDDRKHWLLYWTVNATKQPVLIPYHKRDKPLKWLSDRHALVTPIIWNKLAKSQKTNLLKKDVTRLILIKDLGITIERPFMVDLNSWEDWLANTNAHLSSSKVITTTTAQINLNQVKMAINTTAELNSEFTEAKLRIGKNTFLYKKDLLSASFYRDLTKPAISLVKRLRQSQWLDKTCLKNDYLLKTDRIITYDTYKETVLASLTQLIYSNPSNIFYYVICYYGGGPKDAIKSITSNVSLANHITDFNPKLTYTEQVFQTTGSDLQQYEDYNLMTYYYSILMYKTVVSGGKKVIQSNAHLMMFKEKFKFCVVADLKSTNNNCYVKALSVVLKDKTDVNGTNLVTFRSYVSLADIIDRQGITDYNIKNRLVDTNEAIDIAAYYGYALTIFNKRGDTIASMSIKKANDKCVYDTTINELYMVLDDEHYYLVTKLLDRCDDKTTLNKKIFKFYDPNTTLVYYDLETININDAGMERCAVPYSNVWSINDEYKYSIGIEDPYNNIGEMVNDIIAKARRRYGKVSPKKDSKNTSRVILEYKLIAYNGSNFDFIHLFKYLSASRYDFITPPNATGRLREMKVHLDNETIDGITYITTLAVWDPCLFVQGSLSNVATSFKIDINKLQFDHNVVQKAYESNKLVEWLHDNEKELIDYNVRDVKVLIKVVDKLRKVLGDHCLNCCTLPSYCYYYWRQLIPTNVCKAVKDVKTDEFIRSAAIGGRVEGKIGDWTGDFKMFDVCSLYPYVMRYRQYPIGEETVIEDDIDECIDYFKSKSFIGIYSISVNQKYLRRKGMKHPMLPVRDETLNWKKFTGWTDYTLPDVTIRRLISIDSRCVKFTGKCVVWKKSQLDNGIFDEYIDFWFQVKKEQDALPVDKRNVVLREMAKMILNSLSGKMIQKNYKAKSKYISCPNDLMKIHQQLIKNIKAAEMGVGDIDRLMKSRVSLVSANTGFYCWKATAEEAYKNPKPSQIGVFIYAYARDYMYEIFFSKMEVLYTDTDSALIDSSNRSLVKDYLVKGGVKNLGDLELEASCDRIIVIAPKVYCLIKNGVVIKSRMKGIRRSDICYKMIDDDRVLIGKYNEHELEVFECLQSGCNIVVKTWNFGRNTKEGEVVYRDIEKIVG